MLGSKSTGVRLPLEEVPQPDPASEHVKQQEAGWAASTKVISKAEWTGSAEKSNMGMREKRNRSRELRVVSLLWV